MRWIIGPYPEFGETRIKKGFLFLPKRVDNELRWLEKATWMERYTYNKWYIIRWLNHQG